MTTIVSELFKYLIILLAVNSLPFPTCQVNYKASNYKERNLLGDNAGYSLEFFFFFWWNSLESLDTHNSRLLRFAWPTLGFRKETFLFTDSNIAHICNNIRNFYTNDNMQDALLRKKISKFYFILYSKAFPSSSPTSLFAMEC